MDDKGERMDRLRMYSKFSIEVVVEEDLRKGLVRERIQSKPREKALDTEDKNWVVVPRPM